MVEAHKSQGAHTAGPWFVDPITAHVIVPDRDAPICAMLWPTELRSEDETFANTRMIAAAPCMTEKGSFLLDRIDEIDWSLDSDEFARQWHGHVEPALSRFRAAIANATGAAS